MSSKIMSREPPKYSIGEEVLPKYMPSIEYHGVAMILSELQTPYSSSTIQKWKPVVAELNSTQLNFYALPSEGHEDYVKGWFKDRNLNELESKLDVKSDATSRSQKIHDFRSLLAIFQREQCKQPLTSSEKKRSISGLLNTFPKLTTDNFIQTQTHELITSSNAFKGRLLKSFTLQRSQLGSASDYQMPFVLRMRLETQQILFRTPNFKEFFNWYRQIQIASNLSLPIESRSDPDIETRTIPSYPRIQNNALQRHQVRSRCPSGSGREKITPQPATLWDHNQLNGENLLLLAILSNSPSFEDGEFHQFLQLLYMSRCIKALKSRQKWIGRQVVIYDQLQKADGYIYNTKTLNLFPKTKLLEAESKKSKYVINVQLVRNQALCRYNKKLNGGQIAKTSGEEYFISTNGLVQPA